MNRSRTLLIFAVTLYMTMATQTSQVNPTIDNLVYPWHHSDHIWPEVHVYWRYDMDIQIALPPTNTTQGSLQHITVRVDGLNEKARQDVYQEQADGDLELVHTVIADYRHSIIMEVTGEECRITTFDKSLNLISNIMREMWSPKLDSYTSYLGIQSIALQPSKSYYAFKTYSSDDVEWTVFFNTISKLPEYAVSESFDGKIPSQTVHIERYEGRQVFAEEEFMPKVCFEQRKSEKVEGPIMPLADFGLVY